MPLYEYQCDACDFRFEVIQRYSDPPVATCRSCGGTVRKLLSSPAIQFKGSGWYVTDYGRKGMTDTSGSSPTAAEGKTESPAAKETRAAAGEKGTAAGPAPSDSH